MPHAGGRCGADDAAGAFDVHPAQVAPAADPAGSAQARCTTASTPSRNSASGVLAVRPAEVGRSASGRPSYGAVVRRLPRARPRTSATPADGCGEPAQQRRPEVAAGAGDGDRAGRQVVGREVGHAEPLPGGAAATGGPTVAGVILGAHVILYSTDADADRAFLQNLLGTTTVDAGGGWLILALPPGEVAVHPTDGPSHPSSTCSATTSRPPYADLTARGVEVEGAISDQGWGRLITLRLPGGGALGVYEARHPTAFDL